VCVLWGCTVHHRLIDFTRSLSTGHFPDRFKVVVVVVVIAQPATAVASTLCDHGWQHASRGLQVEGWYLSWADRPSCYGDGLGGVATDCLVVDRAIGWWLWQLSALWAGTSSGWLHGPKGRYAGDWWYRRWMEGQLSRRCLRSGWIGTIWFAAVAFDTWHERPRGLTKIKLN